MEGIDIDIEAPRRRPRTITVLAMLLVFAVLFSYLVAFSAAGALVSAEVITAWPAHRDPRPRWFLITFIVSMGTMLSIGAAARLISRRQLRKIDEMEHAEVPDDLSTKL